MALSTFELARAREITESLLDELGVKAYLFEIAADAGLDVTVDCALDGGAWQTIALPAQDLPGVVAGDGAALDRLRESWREKLASCRI